MSLDLAIDKILDIARRAAAGEVVGTSRQGRDIVGYRFGDGAHGISLIGGCHADEPVGPAMLARLAAYLETLAPDHPLLSRFFWRIVPHANPDGAALNAAWSDHPCLQGDGKSAYDLVAYLGGAVREVCLAYVPEVRAGDYVVVHVGFAISIIDEDEARRTLAWLDALEEEAP